MALTITPNIPRDFRGVPRVAEGGIVEWRVASSDPALGEAVEIRPVGTAFPAGLQPQTVSFAPGSAAHMFAQFQTIDDDTYEVDERFQFVFTPIESDPPPLKWSGPRYGFGPEEDRDGEQEAPA